MTNIKTITITFREETYSALYWTEDDWVVVDHQELGKKEAEMRGLPPHLLAHTLLRELAEQKVLRRRPI
ncbi:MAG: hypothetical protein ACE37K_11295 [Planctomycetota bacterium]